MDFKILEESDNKFFNRKDLKIQLSHHGMPTPKKEELAKELASKYSVPEYQVLIEYIFNKKGIGESVAKVSVYREKIVKKVKKVKEPKEKPKEQPKEQSKEEKHEAQAGQAK